MKIQWINPRTGLWTDHDPARPLPLTEAPLPFYLGVKPERHIGWWQRRRRARLLRKWLRERHEHEAAR